MTRGKKTCKILKEIRTQIAEKNDIEYVTSECGFQGECKGTCPKCEEEVRYLENELRKRQQLGKVVTIAGISLGVAGTFAACGNSVQQSDEKNSQVEDSVKVAQHSSVSINTDSITPVPPPVLGTISDYTTVGIILQNDGCDINHKTVLDSDLIEGKMPTLIDSVAPPAPPTIEIPTVGGIEDELPLRFPEIKAEYPGGMQALLKFINNNFNYPQEAFDAGFQGTVIIGFVVKADGTIDDVKVLKKVHPSLEQEAIRVVKSMPKWKPASSDGVAVSSYFQLPVQFKMEK